MPAAKERMRERNRQTFSMIQNNSRWNSEFNDDTLGGPPHPAYMFATAAVTNIASLFHLYMHTSACICLHDDAIHHLPECKSI